MGHWETSKETESLIVGILPAVAQALGPGWTQGQPDSDGDRSWNLRRLTHEDGRSLFFGVAQGKGDRICVSGGWPQNAAGEVLSPSYGLRQEVREGKVTEITVARTKSPDQIAADLTRRLLPDYTLLWEALRERAAEQDGYRARLLATARKAAALFGVKDGWESRLSRTFSRISFSVYGKGIESIDCHEHTVTLKATVTLAQAEAIAAILNSTSTPSL